MENGLPVAVAVVKARQTTFRGEKWEHLLFVGGGGRRRFRGIVRERAQDIGQESDKGPGPAISPSTWQHLPGTQLGERGGPPVRSVTSSQCNHPEMAEPCCSLAYSCTPSFFLLVLRDRKCKLLWTHH